jgi:hypothetical protein
MRPAGRASYAESGHFVAGVPVLVILGAGGLALLGVGCQMTFWWKPYIVRSVNDCAARW